MTTSPGLPSTYYRTVHSQTQSKSFALLNSHRQVHLSSVTLVQATSAGTSRFSSAEESWTLHPNTMQLIKASTGASAAVASACNRSALWYYQFALFQLSYRRYHTANKERERKNISTHYTAINRMKEIERVRGGKMKMTRDPDDARVPRDRERKRER